jgi:SAM-dependent methyltransferase
MKSRVALILESAHGRILDVGCDHSALHQILYETFNGEVDGLDAIVNRYRGFPRVSEGLAENMPFGDKTFDCVVAGEVIEHLDSPEAFLGEAWRVLRPGGTLVVTTPNRDSWINSLFHTLETFDLPDHVGHKTLFDRESLLAVVSGGFRVKSFHYYVADETSLTGHASRLNNRFTFAARRWLHRILPDRWKEGFVLVLTRAP